MLQCALAKPSPLNAAEFGLLYSGHFDRVKAFLFRHGCEHQILDDLAQETFARAWHARRRFSGNVRFSTWLLGIAKNVAREARRKQAFTPHVVTEIVEAAEAPAELHCELSHSLRDAIDRLPPKQRIAILLVYFDGVTQTEAAIQLNCAHDAFRRRLSSGRSRLRRLLVTNQIA